MMKHFKIKTTQEVYICFNFKDGTYFELTQQQADDINQEIIDIVLDNITVDEINDRKKPELLDGGFDTYPITDEYDYEFWINVPIIYNCMGYIDKSCDFRDPNNITEFKNEYKGIENINKSEILKRLLQLDIGKFINESYFIAEIRDIDYDNIEYIEDEPDY